MDSQDDLGTLKIRPRSGIGRLVGVSETSLDIVLLPHVGRQGAARAIAALIGDNVDVLQAGAFAQLEEDAESAAEGQRIAEGRASGLEQQLDGARKAIEELQAANAALTGANAQLTSERDDARLTVAEGRQTLVAAEAELKRANERTEAANARAADLRASRNSLIVMARRLIEDTDWVPPGKLRDALGDMRTLLHLISPRPANPDVPLGDTAGEAVETNAGTVMAEAPNEVRRAAPIEEAQTPAAEAQS